MPSDNRVRLHDDQGRAPLRPRLSEQHPKQSIARAEWRMLDGAPEDGQLLTQRHVLQRDGSVSATHYSWRAVSTEPGPLAGPVSQPAIASVAISGHKKAGLSISEPSTRVLQTTRAPWLPSERLHLAQPRHSVRAHRNRHQNTAKRARARVHLCEFGDALDDQPGISRHRRVALACAVGPGVAGLSGLADLDDRGID
jgi:hypothetical protein